ncbi:DUF6809 family protein [Paenibacillus silagei]|uniref:Uncharacterized protein n=1 Tax=Paenibacillus silagei TaxID=1670801 RepID=A0ABS4P2L9_9BACL|nr:DUF6809 family protein [Paenibacillus silagei]MBP2115929.1 hypothetical protein [Paenibacillus silagei]
MRTILEALYHGQLQPNMTIVPSHPEYLSACKQVTAETQQWRERLGEEVFRALEEYLDLYDSVNSMYVEAAFHHGFKLGANLLIETMSPRQ